MGARWLADRQLRMILLLITMSSLLNAWTRPMTDEKPPAPAPEPSWSGSRRNTAPRTVELAALLQGANELRIAHGEALYVLRLTRQNKLILTK
jgi:hemin uptake protein HemP